MSERSKQYYEGRQAFFDGDNDLNNPYPIGSDEAMDWFDGLTDEENDQ